MLIGKRNLHQNFTNYMNIGQEKNVFRRTDRQTDGHFEI